MDASFDTIEIQRPDLARSYLSLLRGQPGRPIALFAPRRVGKTYFLEHDLAPTAKRAGFLPVYADVWLQRWAPLEAINHALEEALDDVTVPKSRAGKLAKTPVRKIGAAGASIELADVPQRRALPARVELRLDTLVGRLAQVADKPILLMLDEIQTLGEVPQGEDAIASLRAVLQKRKREVAAVFTGSSQTGLAKIMSTTRTPMYQFAQLLDFPVLGDEYLEQLAAHFARVHRGKELKLEPLRQLFAHIGHKPALMKDIVKSMSAEGITDTVIALDRFVTDDRQIVGWQAILESLEVFDRSVLTLIANDALPFAQESLKLLATPKQPKPTIAKVRSALERLRRAGILSRNADNKWHIEDRLLSDYLVRQRD